MVGGKIISIDRVAGVAKLWTHGASYMDETCVHIQEDDAVGLPAIGDDVWWQQGRVYFDKDRKSLKKIGNSHDPHSCRSQVTRWP